MLKSWYTNIRNSSYRIPTLTMIRSHSTEFPRARIVSHASDTELSSCIKGLASAFNRVPCTNSFSLESGQTVHEYVDKAVRNSLRLGGTLVEAGSTSAIALWELPSRRPAALTSSGTSRQDGENTSVSPIKREWVEVIDQAKRKHIGLEIATPELKSSQIRQHYHLDFLGRNPHVPRVPGAISAVVVPFLDRAKQDQLSVWLEATSSDIVPLYEHFGFRVVEEITVGAGRFDGAGQTKEGGLGVKAWLMLIKNCPTTLPADLS